MATAKQQNYDKENRIRDLREDRDLSQSEIAKVIKTTQQQYSKIETGKADISGEKLKLLAEFYNVSADYILGIETGLTFSLDGYSEDEIALIFKMLRYFDKQRE